jgi:hypothetical protein
MAAFNGGEGTVSNVFQLFQQEKIENPPDPQTRAAIAVAMILSLKNQLACAVEELSKHLDAVGHTTVGLGDTDGRTRIIHAAKLTRERLTKAMLELCQEVGNLSASQQELVETAARRTGRSIHLDGLETVTDGQQKA